MEKGNSLLVLIFKIKYLSLQFKQRVEVYNQCLTHLGTAKAPHFAHSYSDYAILLSSLSDKYFPALGFGGKLGDVVSHEFALNGDPSNPYCLGVQGVVEAYHKALTLVQLWGPTNFAPIIKHVANFAEQAVKNPQGQVRNLHGT